MSDVNIYPADASIAQTSGLNLKKRATMYQQSVADPEEFWRQQGNRIDWIKAPSQIKNTRYTPNDVSIQWYADGQLNVAANCLDRHLAQHGEEIAIIWEGDDPSQSRHISYRELHQEVCQFSNALLAKGAKKGDVITLYMPMIPEAAVAMLACARIGAVHSVIFGGFSPDAIAGRVQGAKSNIVITADEGLRGGKKVSLKANVDAGLANVDCVDTVIVVKRTGSDINWVQGRDCWYGDIVAAADTHHEAQAMGAEDPLFILYTSGSTGQPKGLEHSSAGYLVWSAMTHEMVFDYKPGDIYWCTADVGWITGHSYVVYGPLANRATTLMFEGVPNYPTNARFGQVIEKHKVNQFYTAPTAIRALMQHGDDVLADSNVSSIQVLGSVGEPINPQAWLWYRRIFSSGDVPVVDTWFQTETGGHMITPLPGAVDTKPGSATLPFFGVQPALVDNEGRELEGVAEGNLVIKDSWPGQARSIWGNHQRFQETYFATFDHYYFTGDGARRDEDGYYWITGRVDDVLNVSGHRMGTAEIESALVAHATVCEAAVVGYPHEIKGQGIYCYVTLQDGVVDSTELLQELRQWVRAEIGPIASPDLIQFAPNLPKTRSGKIMRRILRKIAANDFSELGDTSTLSDPSVVNELIEKRCNK
ncbi:MAG: acetate--CoA ligase [Oceanospirillaceae bacterium]|jgi:acetyl-CoA synthetase|nr:acetate--CoA ligase [Oceanospirillaceae bacterium]MBT5630801.1 acetate--CoA ligase [Oceanospirillaceae bacterium]MBT6100998.1 acetate--CoA ligase [Oceanospirillaceae bacterium]MDO7574084.1 acetate--CoA ligase [Oceanospirillaceae bacterium]